MRTVWPLLCLTFGVLTASCETVVDVTVPEHEPQLVVHGFFTPDSVWAIWVSRSVSFTSPEAPTPVEEATVEVWQGDHLLAQPTRADTGLYLANGTGARVDQAYSIRVAAPGFEVTQGSGMLPAPPAIRHFTENVIAEENQEARRKKVRVNLVLEDPVSTSDNYGLFVVQLRMKEDRTTGQWTPLPPSLFPFESSNTALREGGIEFLETDATVYREAFFSDGLFDGASFPLEFLLQYDRPSPDANVVIHRAFVAVVVSASEELYQYWITANAQYFTNENPFAEPLRVYSNLSGGFGVFAGFQYQLFPLRLDSLHVAGFEVAPGCHLLGMVRLPICRGL